MSDQPRIAPGPGAWAMASVPWLLSDPLKTLGGWAHKHGDIVRLRFGGQDAFLLLAPEHVRHVLQDNLKNYTRDTAGYKELVNSLGEGLLTTDGEFWRRQRRIAQPAFHRQRISGFLQTMVDATERMLATWQDGQVIDVGAAMMHVALEIVGATLFGTTVNDQAEAVAQAISDSQIRMATVFNFPLSWPTPANRKLQRAQRTLDEVAYRMIAARRAAPSEGGDLLSMLMAARDEESGEGMTDKQLRNEILTIFAAGHETTANALTWAFYLLGRHPDVYQKQCLEADHALGSAPFSPAVLGSLTYTKQVVDEVLRLYPPIWSLARRTLNDDVIGGYAIPKGSLALVNMYLTHRLEKHWPDPERFDPSRFTAQASEGRPKFAHFPFGGGPHLCIGNGFALMEMQVILTLCSKRFLLEPTSADMLPPWPRVTLSPRQRLMMRVRKRV